MARQRRNTNSPDTEEVEKLTPETETETETETENPTPLPEQLFGEWVTPENLADLAGTELGKFPLTFALTNATSSELTFAELGISLLPYEQARGVTVHNIGTLNMFCMNYAFLAQLSQWHESYGVFVQAAPQDKEI